MKFLRKLPSTKNGKNILSKIEEVSNLIPASDIFNLFNKLLETYKEKKQTEMEIARIDAQKEVILSEITKRYELYREVFSHIFEERKSAIDESFSIIDKGLKNDDKDLIGMGLQSLSRIVSSSPFADIQKLSNSLEGSRVIEI